MYNNQGHSRCRKRCLLSRAQRVTWALLGLILGVACCARSPAQVDSWQSLDGPRANFVIALTRHPSEPTTLYAAVLGGGVLTSTNGGKAWDYLGGVPGPRKGILLAEPDPALLVDCVSVSSDGQVFAGTQGAGVYSYGPETRWIPLTTALKSPNVYAIVLGGGSERYLFAGTSKGLFRQEAPFVRSTAWESLPDDEEGQFPERIQCLFASAELYPRLYVGAQV
jgi:hypothetical protein